MAQFLGNIFQPLYHTGLSVKDEALGIATHLKFYVENYGSIAGLAVWVFGSGEVWKTQLQVLCDGSDDFAMEFKKCTIADNNMIAITGTILAQVAITAIALDSMSQTHWVAKGFLLFCLVASIMAVYYASSQCRVLGRCFRPCEIREWIVNNTKTRQSMHATAQPWMKENMPSPAAVLTMSAPGMLLKTSLLSFLIGMGVYFGFLWTRNLDDASGPSDNRSNFITYIISLGVCYGVYALSRTVSTCQRDFEKLKRLGQASQHFHTHQEGFCGSVEPNNDVKKSISKNESKDSKIAHALLETSSLHRELAAAHNRLALLLEGLPVADKPIDTSKMC